MFELLPEVTTPYRVLIVLIVVIVMIVAIAYFVRRYGADRLGGAATRGRQPRLAVVDQFHMPDGRRQLVIVRRDNVEHLVMIGGPTDIVVEQNIVRAAGASRDKGDAALGRGLSVSETLTRPVPLGEGTLIPLQPESNGRGTRVVAEETMQWTWPPHQETPPPDRAEPRLEKPEISAKPMVDPAAPREPNFARPVTPPAPPRTAATAPAAPAAEKIEKPASAASADENLAEMANLLEASLRRPPDLRAAETPAPLKAEPVVPPALRADPEQRPAPPEPKPPKPEAAPKAAFESLEEEMASLLGRPPGKT